MTLLPEVGWWGNSFEDWFNRRHYTRHGKLVPKLLGSDSKIKSLRVSKHESRDPQ